MVNAVVFVVRDSSTMAAVGLEPKEDDWKMLEVLQRKAATAAMMTKAMKME